MDATGWAAVAAIASACSALASGVGVWFSRRAIVRSSDSADFANCLETVHLLAEAQRKVRDATGDTRKFELRELFNLMEALALLVNENKVPPSTFKVIDNFLAEAWAFAKGDSYMQEILASSVSGSETYAELMKYAKARAEKIERLGSVYHSSVQQ